MEYVPDKIQLELLKRALRNPGGISTGEITSKIGISIKDAVYAFRELRKQNFMKEQQSTLRLTRKGRTWIMNNQTLFAFTGKKLWREVPIKYKANHIAAHEPYAPRTSKLDQKYFKLGTKKNV